MPNRQIRITIFMGMSNYNKIMKAHWVLFSYLQHTGIPAPKNFRYLWSFVSMNILHSYLHPCT